MSHFLKRLRAGQLCEAPLFVKDLNVVQEALAGVQNKFYSAEALKAAGQLDTLRGGEALRTALDGPGLTSREETPMPMLPSVRLRPVGDGRLGPPTRVGK